MNICFRVIKKNFLAKEKIPFVMLLFTSILMNLVFLISEVIIFIIKQC